MSLDFLPKEIEEIIKQNVSEIEQYGKRFQKLKEELKQYEKAEYTYELNEDVWELWCFKGHDTCVVSEHPEHGYMYEGIISDSY